MSICMIFRSVIPALFFPKVQKRENQILVVRKQLMLFGITSQDFLNPHIQLQHVIIVVSDLDVIQRYMEHLTFLISLKGCVLNVTFRQDITDL